MHLGLGLRLGGGSSGGASSSVAITAPVLARTSSAGASPLTWSTTIDGSVYAGYFWRLQVDQTSNAFGAITQEISQMITPSEIAALDGSFSSFLTPSGLYYMRIRVEIDDGASGPGSGTNSAWSNVLTDTIVTSVATFDPANKRTFVTLSGGNLIATVTANAGPSGTRATIEPTTNDTYFETIITKGGNANQHTYVGAVDSTFGITGSTVPGNTSGLGTCYRDDGVIYRNTGTQAVASYTTGDKIGVRINKSTKDVTYYKNGTLIATINNPSMTTFYGYAAGQDVNDSVTANFGATAFTHQPSGTSMYG